MASLVNSLCFFQFFHPSVSAAKSQSDKPLLLALLNGFSEGWVTNNNRCISTICRVGALGLVGVVGAFVAEQVPYHKHHNADDSKDHHGDDA